MDKANQSWTLTFEGHPPGPNDRLSWQAKARSNRKWRSAAREQATALGIPQLGRAIIRATFYRKALGVADEDNDRARLKAIVDGLRDAQVIRNDNRGHVVWGAVNEERGKAGFQVVIEAMDRNCCRCGRDGVEIQPLTEDLEACFECYGMFVAKYLSQHHTDRFREFVKAWQNKET